jgi:PhoH-like ATPase
VQRPHRKLGVFAHVTLTRSERSPIAALVTEMLENVTV